MEIKILQVFLGADGLPYKDQERTVHFPIVGSGFQGASNTTKIRFYYDELVEQDDTETAWVACAKLPNGKIGSKVLETDYDSTLGEHYALLELDSFYFQYKGDVYISLQGYQGGVQVSYDEETELYTINGTPTIAATGSIKLSVNYATQFVGSGETSNVNFQRILADLGTKLGIRAQSEHVEELPSVGQNDIFYVVNDDPNNPNLQNIYVWNENTQSYVWVGDNTLDLGNYYTTEQGEDFEEQIENRVTSVENELESVAQGSPAGVYSTLSDLQNDESASHDRIYLVGTKWYYWNGSAWTEGGTYLSSLPDSEMSLTSTNSLQNKVITKYVKDRIVDGSANINLYNLENRVETDATHYTGTVYITDGYTGDILITCNGTGYAGLASVSVEDEEGNILSTSFGDVYRFYDSEPYRSGKIVNLPSGSYKVSFYYQYRSSGGTPYFDQVMVTKGNTLSSGTYIPFELSCSFIKSPYATKEELNEATGDISSNKPIYVSSTNGDDDNDGLTFANAVATISKALTLSKNIFVERGDYYEHIIASNKDGITIQPYDNDETYSHDNPKRNKINICGAIIKAKSALSRADTSSPYYVSNVEGYYFDSVFSAQVLDAIIDESKQLYRPNVFVIYSDNSIKCKLKPVMSLATCQTTSNSFYWDKTNNKTLYMNISNTNFEKIAIVKESACGEFTNCNKLKLIDCSFNFAYTYILRVINSNDVVLDNCEASYSAINMGFSIDNCNIVFNNCYATHNGYDGFNFHSYGVSILNDCIAEYNYDDGCSHHDGCVGTINGGSFIGNGKCGIAPAYGAEINIYNSYCSNNVIGIGYLSTNNGHANMKGTISSCAMANNTVGLEVDSLCTVVSINCVYSGNTTNKYITGTLVEY